MTKAVLVTGAARRIGRAIALELAGHGYAVAIHYHRSADEARELAAKLESAGVAACAICGDLVDPETPARLVASATESLGPLCGLVNNASIFEPDDALTVETGLWDRQLGINLRAPVQLARHFAAILPAGMEGTIVNIVDQRVLKPTPYFLSYGLSKAALWAATRTLAQGLAPRIRVNAVAPGPTFANPRQSEADFRRQQEAVLLGRGPTAGEIAAAVRFLLESPSVTGQMLAVDGGQHLAWATPDVAGVRE